MLLSKVLKVTFANSLRRAFSQAVESKPKIEQMKRSLNLLLQTALPSTRNRMQVEFESFLDMFSRYLDEPPLVDWKKIGKLPGNAVISYHSLQEPSEDEICDLLNKLVVVKLNGGLGTSMGMTAPKSLLVVRGHLSFLQLTMEQFLHINQQQSVDIPVVLMNSFNTNNETKAAVRDYDGKLYLRLFDQSAYPRIRKDVLLPAPLSGNINQDKDAWYPPGHGDFYGSFFNSGLLKKFLDEGKKYCYISNIDNLGATVDIRILNLMENPRGEAKHEFLMEVVQKTLADVKGGALTHYDGKTRLLEIAQVPKDHIKDFEDIKVFKYFNTNNLWFNLEAIYEKIKAKKILMDVIPNAKKMKNKTEVIQLETAMGAAMGSFNAAVGVDVPRSRFLPVKKTSDLLLVKSNFYVLENGTLRVSPERKKNTVPVIKLGAEFKDVADFLRRFPHIPDLIDLDYLEVQGDVAFGRNVVLAGSVIIIADKGRSLCIPDDTVLCNKKVMGSLTKLVDV